MRYEKIDWQLSTGACDALLKALGEPKVPWGFHTDAVINSELWMVHNELRARLQRTDTDMQAPKNFEEADPNADLLG